MVFCHFFSVFHGGNSRNEYWRFVSRITWTQKEKNIPCSVVCIFICSRSSTLPPGDYKDFYFSIVPVWYFNEGQLQWYKCLSQFVNATASITDSQTAEHCNDNEEIVWNLQFILLHCRVEFFCLSFSARMLPIWTC